MTHPTELAPAPLSSPSFAGSLEVSAWNTVLGVFLCALFLVPLPLRAQEYQFIAHPSLGLDEARVSRVAALYLGGHLDEEPWSRAHPIDLPPDSPIRDAFSQQILLRQPDQVESYWQRKVFEGKGVPPARLESSQAVIDFVAATPGAFGYIASNVRLPAGVSSLNPVMDRASGTVISGAPPNYPPMARRVRAEGTVLLQVKIDARGNVDDIEIVEDQPFGLGEAAVDTVKRWKFAPVKLGDEPVSAIFQLPIDFQL